MSRKVLVIEDNENNRVLVQFLLERAGCEVLSTDNGLLGLEMAATARPDIILMDIQMPEMDGYETAERLRRNSLTSGIPIVGISSYAMPDDRTKAFAHGFKGYLEKPINPETFAEQILGFMGIEGGG